MTSSIYRAVKLLNSERSQRIMGAIYLHIKELAIRLGNRMVVRKMSDSF